MREGGREMQGIASAGREDPGLSQPGAFFSGPPPTPSTNVVVVRPPAWEGPKVVCCPPVMVATKWTDPAQIAGAFGLTTLKARFCNKPLHRHCRPPPAPPGNHRPGPPRPLRLRRFRGVPAPAPGPPPAWAPRPSHPSIPNPWDSRSPHNAHTRCEVGQVFKCSA